MIWPFLECFTSFPGYFFLFSCSKQRIFYLQYLRHCSNILYWCKGYGSTSRWNFGFIFDFLLAWITGYQSIQKVLTKFNALLWLNAFLFGLWFQNRPIFGCLNLFPLGTYGLPLDFFRWKQLLKFSTVPLLLSQSNLISSYGWLANHKSRGLITSGLQSMTRCLPLLAWANNWFCISI